MAKGLLGLRWSSEVCGGERQESPLDIQSPQASPFPTCFLLIKLGSWW